MSSTRKQTSSRTVQKAVIESSSQVENQESQWQQALLKTQEQGLDAAFAWLETLPELQSGAGQVKKVADDGPFGCKQSKSRLGLETVGTGFTADAGFDSKRVG